MRIGELARRRGIRASAIRYYESVGLLPPPRRVSGRRDYGEDAVRSLRIVQALQRSGFSLAEIRALVRAPLPSSAAPTSASASASRTTAWREAARAKLSALDEELRQLQEARRALSGALRCTCKGDLDRCRLVAATEGAARRASGR